MSGYDEEFLPPEDSTFAGPDLDEEVIAGKAAAAFRSSETYQAVMAQMRHTVYAAFKATPARDIDGFRYIHALSQTVEDFDTILAQAVETGRLAAEQIQRKQDDYRTEEAA